MPKAMGEASYLKQHKNDCDIAGIWYQMQNSFCCQNKNIKIYCMKLQKGLTDVHMFRYIKKWLFFLDKRNMIFYDRQNFCAFWKKWVSNVAANHMEYHVALFGYIY